MNSLNRKSPHLNLFLFLSLGIMLLFASCVGSNSHRSLLNHVPSSSYTVLAVNWKTVSKDPDLKKISKGAVVEKLFANLGIESATVTEFSVYGDPGNSGQTNNGLIASGSFDCSTVVKGLIAKGWTEQSFAGRKVYVNPHDRSWLTTFDKNLFVLGTESGVRDAIGARANPEDRFTSNPAYKTLSSQFEGKQYPILMMLAIPEANQDMAHAAIELTSTAMDLAGVGPLGDLLSKIGYAQGLGCAISHKDESFPIAVSAVMKDEESAKFVSGSLNLLKGLGRMASRNYASEPGANAANAIENMSIERKREVVSISMTMSKQDLNGIR